MKRSGPAKSKPWKTHAVAVLIATPTGIPLVRDSTKPKPVYWKAPGGRGSAAETAEQTAIREVKEEIGLTLLEKDLELVDEKERPDHTLTFFIARLPTLPFLNSSGEAGEEVRVFLPTDIISMANFFPNHLQAFEKTLVGLCRTNAR
jgi:ADP-ribose pyrophosphatase YjhB (NUDIX family)